MTDASTPTGSRTPFLTASWRDLALVTWRVEKRHVHAHLPAGCEPDRPPDDDDSDAAYVSLVAFRFLDTRVKGIAVPLHRDFPEINLRLYVRTTDEPVARRGVTFVAELVPKPLVAAIANVLYHESYRALPMDVVAVDQGDDRRRLDMNVQLPDRVHTMSLVGKRPAVVPDADSREHFFKEHEWGFARHPDGHRVVYRVGHPIWAVYPTSLDALRLDVDFAGLYGPPWGVLGDRDPVHVAFAVGSAISVDPKDD